jgi:shikimate kinase
MNTDLQSDRVSQFAPVIALTGFMAVGKSTIGRELSCLLHWHLIDLDCEIERGTGLRVQDIFSRHGEPHFRRLESDALRSVLDAATTPTVIALGGGTFVQPSNAELLRGRGAQVVFLELDVQMLLQRCREAHRSQLNPRPLARDEAAFCSLYEQRLPFYRQADLTLSTCDKTASQVAHEVAATLGLLSTKKPM